MSDDEITEKYQSNMRDYIKTRRLRKMNKPKQQKEKTATKLWHIILAPIMNVIWIIRGGK